jgi:hypothetical protein
MLDVELFGLDPRGHHGTSVLLHAMNSLLIFALLIRTTGGEASAADISASLAQILRLEELVKTGR